VHRKIKEALAVLGVVAFVVALTLLYLALGGRHFEP
jgi:hypothetical protein